MLAKLLLKLIRLYQVYLRGYLPVSCRFDPTCSEYSRQALEKYGILQGGLKAVKRILRCHPFSRAFGSDPLV